MSGSADIDAPLGDRRAIIRRNPDNLTEGEVVEAAWSYDPRFAAGGFYGFVRSRSDLPDERWLIAASGFHMRISDKHLGVTPEDGNLFYLAGHLGAGDS